MKNKATIGALALVAALAAYSQGGVSNPANGSFSTTMQWEAYPTNGQIAGFRLFFGTTRPGEYSTNYVISNALATSFVARTEPGTTNYSALQAFAADGRVSPLSAEVTWINPPLLSAPVGYRPAAIVYVPSL